MDIEGFAEHRLPVPAPFAFALENVKPRHPVTVTATHTFDPDGDACAYTWAMAFEAHGILGRLLGPRIARFMHANAKTQPVRLRAALEQR